MIFTLPRWLLALPLLLVVHLSCAEIAVPPLSVRVMDLTKTLTAPQRQNLEQVLQAFEARKGSQIAVLIVPTTHPEAIEQYSLRVAEAWKLGRKGIDDGVLLLVAKDDHEVRIEVGYGLEGIIPDAVAKRIIAEIVVPFFKQGDFYGGIDAGVNRLIRLVDGEPLPPPQARDSTWSLFNDLMPFGIIAVIVGGNLLRVLFGRLVGAAIAAGVTSLVVWIMFSSLFAAVIATVIVFVFVLAAGMQTASGRYGGWPGGGSGGMGGMGGGGFSGGGGGFGGGGASGRW